MPEPTHFDDVVTDLTDLENTVVRVRYTERLRDDVLMPEAPDVRLDGVLTEPLPVVVPTLLQPFRCPVCTELHSTWHPDPLQVAHRPGCRVGEAEDDQLRLDVERLRRRPGLDHFHRLITDAEWELMDANGMDASTRHMKVTRRVDRVRSWVVVDGAPGAARP